MTLPFPLPPGGAKHEFCTTCFADGVKTVSQDGLTAYECPRCKAVNRRRIVVGGGLKLWQGRGGEIYHESAGVFVRNPAGKYLFFELTTFPFGFTIPAGHVDEGESAKQAAVRELEEEVGIKANNVALLAECEIQGDKCSSGADVHCWHAFIHQLAAPLEVVKCEEGKDPQWLTVAEAKSKKLPPAISYLIEHYGDKLA